MAKRKWALRRGNLFLVPGDSPVGYRLPLPSLPWVPQSSLSVHPAQRPVGRPRSRLPDRDEIAPASLAATKPRRGRAAGTHRTRGRSKARCARRFVGRAARRVLCVFMPPVEALEDYLELLAAVEATPPRLRPAGAYRRLSAAARSAPQRHQGHARSRRHRSQHPSGGEAGASCVDTTHLYEEPARSRLGAEKFMIDGRHTGTGGGNHVVMGGATPAD